MLYFINQKYTDLALSSVQSADSADKCRPPEAELKLKDIDYLITVDITGYRDLITAKHWNVV